MENYTLGKRIAALRREKELKQDELAEMLNVSPQAVSKWENDLSCPDISILPQLAKILGVTVDELLTGKTEIVPVVTALPEEQHKELSDMILRIVVESSDGDTVKVNLPISLIQTVLESGMEMPQVNGSEMLKSIDISKILELAAKGVVGNLVEVDSADGDKVRIFVE